MLAVTLTPLTEWWATALAGPWRDPAGDVLVVLGGSVLDNGTVGGSSYWRAVYGAQAYSSGGFQTLVLIGGRHGDLSIGASMGALLLTLGVPAGRMVLEEQSTSTRENALQAAPILSRTPGRKVLLTSDYHMFRAIRAFRKAGMEMEPRPYPDVRKRAQAWENRWACFQDLVLETVKIGYYAWKGWI